MAFFYVQPHLVLYLTSEEGWHAEAAFLNIAKAAAFCETIDAARNINAYNLEAAMAACEQAFERFPASNWEWTFTIGSGPKITGIAAYEVAKRKDIPCLFIDTLHEKMVSLVKTSPFEVPNLFHIDVATYMQIQRRTYQKRKGKTAKDRKILESWGHITSDLVKSDNTDLSIFARVMRDAQVDDEKALPLELVSSPLLQLLEKTYRLIDVKPGTVGEMLCTFTSHQAVQLLSTGTWLEIYVWYEAILAGFADDCQWGYEIIDGNARNELDLALTYRAQLIIGECKTDYEPFKDKRQYLDTLDSNANLLGGLYVTKLFITNQPMTKKGYDSFKEQADRRRIVVVTLKELPDIGAILKREALTPTYPRV